MDPSTAVIQVKLYRASSIFRSLSDTDSHVPTAYGTFLALRSYNDWCISRADGRPNPGTRTILPIISALKDRDRTS